MNAVIYARYSSDSQREESIEGQLRECREYAERNNMTIVGTYIDRALSAKTADRPELQYMIKDSAKGLFKIDKFVNAVYVFDDKLVLTYNYQHGTQTISLEEIESALSSDFDGATPPKEEASNSSFTRMSLRLCIDLGTPDGVPFPFALP